MQQELIEILIKAAEDQDANVRKSAALALGENSENVYGKNALVKLLRDKVWQVRETAIYSIGKAGVVEAADVLMKMIGAEDDASARKAILQWATAKGDTDAEQDKTKQAAGLGGAAAPPKKPAGDPWQVKKAAALMLSKLRPDITARPLLMSLNIENPNARIAAMAGLGNIQAMEAVGPLIELLQDKDWNIRKMAAVTLGRLKAAEATDALLELLDDDKFAVRQEAVIAINHIKPEEALSALSKTIVKDNNYEVRKVAAIALGNLKNPDAAIALVNALKDENWMVRKAAVDSLTNLRVLDTIGYLIYMLRDEQEDVRAAAAVGIIRLGQLLP